MKLLITIYLTSLAIAGMAEELSVPEIFHDNNIKFTARMFNEVANINKDKTLVISAFSVMPPLGQLALASVGESHDEVLKTIGIRNDNMTKDVFTYTNYLVESVKGVTLKIASKIYVSEGYKLNKQFSVVSKEVFNSEVENIDFGKSQDAANHINQWVEEQTNNKIKDLVRPDSISHDTKALLANAIYFKGNWKDQFRKFNTMERDFHVSKTEKTKLEMMNRKGDYKYFESTDLKAQVLELPYVGDEMSLVVILPHEIDGLHELKEKLKDPLALDNAVNSVSKIEVNVFLPKVKIETETNLKEVLEKMGITKLFDPQMAKLDNLLESSSDLYIDSATQKAFIEINEEGTEAAAANAFGMAFNSLVVNETPTPLFIADRPFYFALKLKSEYLFNGVMYK